jgi:hypothetical protein
MKIKINKQIHLPFLFILLIISAFVVPNLCQIINTRTKEGEAELLIIKNNLSTKSLEDLKPIAIRLENYSNTKRGGLILGGLHDYIGQISKEDLLNFCMRIIKENKELVNLEKLNEVIEGPQLKFLSESQPQYQSQYQTQSQSQYQSQSKSEEGLTCGGLHDYIFLKDRKTLLKWALAGDAYQNSKCSPITQKEEVRYDNNRNLILNMSNEELIKFILNKARRYKELDNGDMLDRLSENFCKEKLIENMKKIQKLNSALSKLDRQKLIRYAYACEFYERKGQQIYGGLHDYIHNLSNDQIRAYITRKAQKYEELNSLENLEIFSRFSNEFKFLNSRENPNDNNNTNINANINDNNNPNSNSNNNANDNINYNTYNNPNNNYNNNANENQII